MHVIQGNEKKWFLECVLKEPETTEIKQGQGEVTRAGYRGEGYTSFLGQKKKPLVLRKELAPYDGVQLGRN